MAISSTMACMTQSREIVAPSSFLKQINVTAPLSTTATTTTTTTGASSHNVKVGTRQPRNWRVIARISSDDSTTVTETETWEGGEGGSVEVAKGPPSLISTLNVEKALRGIAITDVDYYAQLGLPRGCPYDQVRVAYQTKVKELSSKELGEDEFNKELQLLQESYRVLSTEEERRLYDWSLARNEAPERFAWPFEVDITQAPVGGTPPMQEPEDVGPTTAVGYFLLAWFLLACCLSILLNI